MGPLQRWTPEQMGDLSGSSALVTGANSGIGFETALALARHGARVVLGCRDQQKGRMALEQIEAQMPQAKLELLELDLADLTAVKSSAQLLLDSVERLDLLINNAGVMMPPFSKTADGFELQFGTNHLGHFALTGHLLPLLLATPKARVVTVSSIVHRQGRIDFDNLNAEKGYRRIAAYSQSKLANLLFTLEFNKRLKAQGHELLVVSAHPGWSATQLQRTTPFFAFLNHFFAQAPAMGAQPSLLAATEEGLRGGEYFGPRWIREFRGPPVRAKIESQGLDEQTAQKLWEVSEEMTGVRYLESLTRFSER